jgi:hypothetical protein
MPKDGPVRKPRYVAAILVALCMAPVLSAQPKSALTMAQVDTWMIERSNWGRWGKDDQRGTLNLMTPGVREQALKLVLEGVSVSPARTIEKDSAPDAQPSGVEPRSRRHRVPAESHRDFLRAL